MWKICNSGAILIEISRNKLKHKGNKNPIFKGILRVGNGKKANHVAVARNISNVVVNNLHSDKVKENASFFLISIFK